MNSSTSTPPVILLLALLIGALVRVVKSPAINTRLASVGLPPIPKAWLPWLAGGLGLALGVIDGVIHGSTWQDAAASAFGGLLAGGFATWGHEAGVESLMAGHEVMAPKAEAAPVVDDRSSVAPPPVS